eukprot:6176980-Pleurochrysis_carterae.AAC.2
MAPDTGRSCVVHAGRGGVVTVGVGIYVCGDAWSSSKFVIVVSVIHHHELVDAWPSVSSSGGWYSAAHSGNTVSHKTTFMVVMSLPLRGLSST